ncbi:uncharacterized protein LOC100868005, partial [Apis florea]|uniref:uncharacterized protein LOC100868005 n=1 Tax=Apis florea TaxID=7463 RepID=UPI0012FF3410
FVDNLWIIISIQETTEPSPEPTARETEAETYVTETEITKAEVKPIPFEPPRLKKGIIALWRARCITPYNPDLLPPEPIPLQEEISVDSLIDKCSEDLSIAPEQFLKYEDEYEGEGEIYYEEDYPIPSAKLT